MTANAGFPKPLTLHLFGACRLAINYTDKDFLFCSGHAMHYKQSAVFTIVVVMAILPTRVLVAQNVPNQNEYILFQKASEAFFVKGDHAQGIALFKQAVALAEQQHGEDSLAVANPLSMYGMALQQQGEFDEAESSLKRALTITEMAVGPNDPQVAHALDALALFYRDQGKFALAERLAKRSLEINEKYRPQIPPNFPNGINNFYESGAQIGGNLALLADIYKADGKYTKAIPLMERYQSNYEKWISSSFTGSSGALVSTSLWMLADLYVVAGEYEKAEPVLQRSIALVEKSDGPDGLNETLPLITYAQLYFHQGKHDLAEATYKRALAIYEKKPLHSGEAIAIVQRDLADLYRTKGQYDQAEVLYKRFLAFYQERLGPDHPWVAEVLDQLAELYQAEQRDGEALTFARQVTEVYRKRIVAGGVGGRAVWEAGKNKTGFTRHLELLAQNPDRKPSVKVADEALQVVQLAQASGTAFAVAKMAARFAAGTDELAGLARRRQDAADRINSLETRFLNAVSRPAEQRSTDVEQKMRNDLTAANHEIAMIDAELGKRFPQYQELTSPEPIAADKIRSALKPGEAMLVFQFDQNSCFSWVITKQGGQFIQANIDLRTLNAQVRGIRSAMQVDDRQHLVPVDVKDVYNIYQLLFAPLLPHLSGISHIMVVPSGPLQSLPLSMLIASAPPDIHTEADYRQVDWLVNHYAISMLPSVSSIRALRQFARSSQARDPFAGFGDPATGAGNSAKNGAKRNGDARLDISAVYRSVSTIDGDDAPSLDEVLEGPELADVDVIRRQPNLPETADELKEMARVLTAGSESLWLRENATETNVKRLDLSRFRIIAFATHGIMAGQVNAIGEPGLLLTPPAVATLEDDGYLSASEIAHLKLNSDWVVLSACNTAAADGRPGAEGFSGLAKAFFYAGARSLLVSHWPVDSEATVPLTTSMLREYASHPALGRAEANRRAMVALMNLPDRPEFAHPLFWAPFVVVGEGGADD